MNITGGKFSLPWDDRDSEDISLHSDSFIVDIPALDLYLAPRHDLIGNESPANMTQICATIKANELPRARAPVDIIVALDVSGSMRVGKLDLCKKTLGMILRELHSHDRFGLVVFDTDARLEIHITELSDEYKEVALSKIEHLETGGFTNISAAIELAVKELKSVQAPNEVRTIFLLTDGHPNRGIRDEYGIRQFTKERLASYTPMGAYEPPITIHSFGYGSDHDVHLLRSVSHDTAGGSYYHIHNDASVASAFGDALGGILSVIAQNVVLTIRLPPENSKYKDGPEGIDDAIDVHHWHDQKKQKMDDGSFNVILGDFYAEESRDVVFEVPLQRRESKELNEDEDEYEPIPHAIVSLTYMDTIRKRAVTRSPLTAFISRPDGREMSDSNLHVAVQWLRVRATKAMTEAGQLSRNGDLKGARGVIQNGLNEIWRESTIGIQSDPIVAQVIVDLNEVLQGLESTIVYDGYGAYHLESKRQTHMMQRSAESSTNTNNVYQGKSKRAMAHRMGVGK
eukprot:scaffold89095_cov46-Attheya_sp.AAC.4